MNGEPPTDDRLFRRLRVFVASPRDVQAERDAIGRVIDEINLTIGAISPEKRLFIELVKWETHVPPGLGRPQGLVNDSVQDYDVFVGILWKRMGTPTGVADSGTEEEFQLARRKWEEDRSTPVLLYFCQAPFPPPRTTDEVDQLGKVVAFKNGLATSGLVADYATHDSFADVVRPHLLLTISKLASRTGEPAVTASAVAEAVKAESGSILPRIEELATCYETLRRTMEPGDARTRQMEIVASSMRSLALAGRSLAAQFASSDSPGKRLALVSFLEVLPDKDYVSWLAGRLAHERPFVGYRAAMALLAAARTLDELDLPVLATEISRAKSSLELQGKAGTDRWLVLETAEEEVRRRRPPPHE